MTKFIRNLRLELALSLQRASASKLKVLPLLKLDYQFNVFHYQIFMIINAFVLGCTYAIDKFIMIGLHGRREEIYANVVVGTTMQRLID